MKGPISDDEKRVTVRGGRAPRKNADCDIVGYDEDELIFEHKETLVRE